MSKTDFCTCNDFDCQFHHKHQSNECTACIAKNLNDHEVPACFWNKIGEETSTQTDYTFRKFAEKVMSCEK